MEDRRVQIIEGGEMIQLHSDAIGGDPIAEAVQKQVTGRTPGFTEPSQAGKADAFGNVDAAHSVSLGVQVNISHPNMFRLQLNQFADAEPGAGHEPDCKIIVVFFITDQAIL